MRRLRLAIVLPIAQVLIAGALFAWGHQQWHTGGLFVPPARLFCFALNAPAVFFWMLLDLFPGGNAPDIFGLYFDEVVVLVGVAITWFSVGRDLDIWRSRRPHTRKRMTAPKVLFNLFLLG